MIDTKDLRRLANNIRCDEQQQKLLWEAANEIDALRIAAAEKSPTREERLAAYRAAALAVVMDKRWESDTTGKQDCADAEAWAQTMLAAEEVEGT